MSFFNVSVGIFASVLVLIPLWYIKRRGVQWILVVAAVAIGIASTQWSSVYLYPHYLGWKFEREIRQQPLFRLVAKYHPEKFQLFLDRVKVSFKQKEDPKLVAVYAAQLINAIFYVHLEKAPNEPIFLYLKATLALYRYLYTAHPQVIMQFELGQADLEADLPPIWEDKHFQLLLERVLEMKQWVIEAALTAPVTLQQEMATPLINEMLDRLTQKFGEALVQQVFSSKVIELPTEVVVPVLIDFYSVLITLGQEKAGIIMRYIANEKVAGLNKNSLLQP